MDKGFADKIIKYDVAYFTDIQNWTSNFVYNVHHSRVVSTVHFRFQVIVNHNDLIISGSGHPAFVKHIWGHLLLPVVDPLDL